MREKRRTASRMARYDYLLEHGSVTEGGEIFAPPVQDHEIVACA